jgi:hypothetical protein
MFHHDSEDDSDYDSERICWECSRPIIYGVICSRCWILDEAIDEGEIN